MDAAVFDGTVVPPVTVVRAPAGAGKTTMLAAWARRRAERHDTHIAWVSVDSEDNDSALLWQAILRALKCSGAWQGDCPLDRLTPPSDSSYPAFINAVAAEFERLPWPVVLVLDGIHEVRSGDAVRTLNMLLRHLPATLRLVLATRFPPPLILPRLMLEGRLREIGPDELVFTAAQARLLYAKEGIRLTDAGLRVLMERTEGWAAGLRMAAMTVAGSAQPGDIITRFDGDDCMVADYLMREVFGRQPDDVQQFMLSTCVCRAFTTDLAVELSGQENAGQIIDRLERTSILASGPDKAQRWFRYHPLMRGCLRGELGRRRLSRLRRQHRVAADWLLTAGDPLRAVEHGIWAGDDELVTRVVARSGLGQILKGQSRRLTWILGTVPVRVLNRPSVALVAAAAALDLGDLPETDRWLRRIDNAAHPLRTHRLRALHATVQLHRSRLRGEVGTALETLRTTRAGQTGDLDLDLLAVFNRGVAKAWTGHHQAAQADLRHALRVAVSEQRDAVALACRSHLAAITAASGDLRTMNRQAANAISFAESKGWADTSRSAYAYAMLGLAAYQWLDDDEARSLASLATRLMPDPADPTIELCGLTLQSMIAFDVAEDPHEVVATLRGHWQRFADKAISPALTAYAAPAQQRMALRVGEYTWAREVLERVEHLGIPCGEPALLRAILHAHRGKVGSPRRLLVPVLTGQTRTIVATTVVEAWLLEAHLADHAGHRHRAHEALCEALAIAAPQNALRPFRDAGRSVRALLAGGAGRFGRLETFATTAREALPVRVHDLADGLTEREQALLAELPSMRTVEEIAQTMFVSANTVKTHLRGIYRKLGVRHRRDAISAARQRGLL